MVHSWLARIENINIYYLFAFLFSVIVAVWLAQMPRTQAMCDEMQPYNHTTISEISRFVSDDRSCVTGMDLGLQICAVCVMRADRLVRNVHCFYRPKLTTGSLWRKNGTMFSPEAVALSNKTLVESDWILTPASGSTYHCVKNMLGLRPSQGQF